jgi:DNA mismatch repair ATPase MutS
MADAYAGLIGLVCDAPFETPLLRELQERLGRGFAARADVALQRIGRVAAWAEVRASPMMHGVLQLLLAWDRQIVRAVERWRTSFGPSLGGWFSALAEIECIAALAGLAHANPAWTFPDLAPEPPLRLRARGLGHPLLPDGSRVLNDVEVGPPGTVLLISGSNMSGKSTLLRAIGLNALLARVGGPVCAEAMWCPPLRLCTSLRVQDSLAAGISYFMAEALRLRDIVFAAEESAEDGAAPVLYLVDEILRGTNSEERAVASRFIVARLLKTSAIGAITTHDLGVFDVPEIAERARHAHFAEQFTSEGGERRLTFDYHLRPGPTTSSNALELLSLIGLTEG